MTLTGVQDTAVPASGRAAEFTAERDRRCSSPGQEAAHSHHATGGGGQCDSVSRGEAHRVLHMSGAQT